MPCSKGVDPGRPPASRDDFLQQVCPAIPHTTMSKVRALLSPPGCAGTQSILSALLGFLSGVPTKPWVNCPDFLSELSSKKQWRWEPGIIQNILRLLQKSAEKAKLAAI